jgi:cholesterol transport system auxiliary component
MSIETGHSAAAAAALSILVLLAGCAGALGSKEPPPSFYSLDDLPSAAPTPVAPAGALTVIVNPPHGAAGFDSRRMIYLHEPHERAYFAHNQWVDTPARMLAPMVVSALQRSGAFRAVVQSPSTAAGDVRLDTDVIRLQQEFTQKPSSVRFTLRAVLTDNTTRKVLGSKDFEAVVSAPSDNPQGGVAAANEAVRKVLDELAVFTKEAAARLPPGSATPPRAAR